jgi:hypothetical protein
VYILVRFVLFLWMFLDEPRSDCAEIGIMNHKNNAKILIGFVVFLSK